MSAPDDYVRIGNSAAPRSAWLRMRGGAELLAENDRLEARVHDLLGAQRIPAGGLPGADFAFRDDPRDAPFPNEAERLHEITRREELAVLYGSDPLFTDMQGIVRCGDLPESAFHDPTRVFGTLGRLVGIEAQPRAERWTRGRRPRARRS